MSFSWLKDHEDPTSKLHANKINGVTVWGNCHHAGLMILAAIFNIKEQETGWQRPFSTYQTDTSSLLLTFRRVSLWSQWREQTRIVPFLLQLHQLMMMTGKQERKSDLTSSAFCSSEVQRPRKAEGSITWEIHVTTVRSKEKKKYLFSLSPIRQTFIKYYSYALYLNCSMLKHISKYKYIYYSN